MRKVLGITTAILLSLSLSGCFFAAVGAAGAGGGYIYKEKEEQGKAP